MNAYTPSPRAVVLGTAALAATLLLAFAVSRMKWRTAARIAAWGLVAAAVAAADRITASEPAGVRMLGIIALVLGSMKAVVSVESPAQLGPARWFAFAAAWPGMRPAVFAAAGGPPLPGAWRLAALGAARLLAGAALVALARGVWATTGSRAWATLPLLPGLSLMLHFGVFNLLAGGWRALGADTTALFKAPLLSKSLTEFWGRRWNLAFSEMTALGVYRPLAGLAGRPVALVAAFLCSGLFHELAISMPVRAGYGLPLLYFALHGGLMLLESFWERQGRPVSSRAWIGRLWTLTWLALPLPLLFHPPFLEGVVWPLLVVG